ncbi:MAG: ThiF family adenylyltransferase, partial [Nanoarchaeota archaeon]|nr:ThiF family adenylyltransferase [Nanoarchaeota archaeon]
MEIRRLILVGAGALGSFFLLSAGRLEVDRIDVFDGDIVRKENIGNQPIFSLQDARRGLHKTDALMRIKAILKPTELVGHNFYVTGKNVKDLPIGKCTVIIDCSDNIETKLLLNAVAIKEKIPLLSLSAHGAKESVYLMDGREACLECIYGGVFDKLSRADCDRLSPVYASFV